MGQGWGEFEFLGGPLASPLHSRLWGAGDVSGRSCRLLPPSSILGQHQKPQGNGFLWGIKWGCKSHSTAEAFLRPSSQTHWKSRAPSTNLLGDFGQFPNSPCLNIPTCRMGTSTPHSTISLDGFPPSLHSCLDHKACLKSQYNRAWESLWGTKAHYKYEVLFLFQGESGIPRILGLIRSEAV